MPSMPGPSTRWAEKVEPDEEQRFARYGELFRQIQEGRAKRWGAGRTLHRKQLVVAHGSLEVLDGLAPYAKYGLFAEPRDYEVVVRLSNGGLDNAPDRVPDIRGFAIRVMGVQGLSALGGEATTQDFTLINQEAFAFPRAEEFVEFVNAASQGNGALFRHVLRRYGVLGAPKRLAGMLKTVARPFSGFATEKLYSTLPMANGPYAVRVRLVPADTNGPSHLGARSDWGGDFCERLRKHPLHWDMQLQYFANEKLTPIEDASVNWPTPYTTVARLMLPRQDPHCESGVALAREVEGGVIDPWRGLAEHRPLGEVQRARKAIYYISQQGRGAT
ncbi:catalase [Ramlibacter humi]|uniref:Catalase n=1 Tax=Ramlibacter humi TaxID=2530451 RepID=A0A4Z0BGV9_9BURK|nr:catalase [Ramlibacter humi]TFY97619.1 catalase [Ramlibacter humi]